jgi:glycosyltransferase involved in cell wall biosynthesis
MKALYLPGPSYFDDAVKEVAGWWHILKYQREAIELAGYEVDTPEPPAAWMRFTPSYAKISAYSLWAADRDLESYDLIVGAPSYAHIPFFKARRPKKVAYVWNNADPYRRRQLEPEYKMFGVKYQDDRDDRAADDINELMNRMSLQACDHVIACSPFVKKTHAAVVPEEKISVAFWGVDTELFKPPEKKEWPSESRPLRVLFSGGDPIRKGLTYLVQAIAGSEILKLRVELGVIGCKPFNGSHMPSFKVTQLGMVPFKAMPDLMAQFDVVCIPTLEDGIACAIQEGMACGLVPITTEECAEVFKPGESGFSVSYRDPEQITFVLELLVKDPARLIAMSILVRREAESQKWSDFKDDFADILGSVAKERQQCLQN